jgi:hypothetical protein
MFKPWKKSFESGLLGKIGNNDQRTIFLRRQATHGQHFAIVAGHDLKKGDKWAKNY